MKYIILVAAMFLTACSVDKTLSDHPKQDAQLCSTQDFLNGKSGKLNMDSGLVIDKGNKFSFSLDGGNKWVDSLDLVVSQKDRVKSLKDSEGFYFIKGVGEYKGVYSFANKKGWMLVFNCNYSIRATP